MAKRTVVTLGKSLEFVRTDYKRFVDVLNRDMRRIMQDVSQIILERTLPWVPHEFGGLRQSGRAFAGRTDRGWAAFVSFGGEEAPVDPTPNAPQGVVDYAIFVHEGHGKVAATKFLEIGGREAESEVDAYITRELKKLKPKSG